MIKTMPWLLLIVCCQLLGCNQGSVGEMSGLVVQSGQTTSVSINFTSMTFPTPTSSATLIIEMTNLSGNRATITLSSPNPSGTGLQAQFPTGTYAIASNGNSFTSTLTVQGTNTADFTAVGGSLVLQALQTGLDADGNPAIAVIQGEFVIDLPDDGFVQGSFAADFTA